MKSLPKGVYRQRKKLADGSVTTYLRWRPTGKRIEGEPGTAEFGRNFLAAKKPKHVATKAGTWGALIEDYKRSPRFRSLAASSRKIYDRQLEHARRLSALPVSATRRSDILVIRDAIALTAPSMANQFTKVMSILFDFAVERDVREANPLTRLKPIKGGTHETWSDAQIKHALKHFKERFRRAVILALYTGQREEDCVAMTWAQYDGSGIQVTPGKTKNSTAVSLWIPVHKELKRELDAWRATSTAQTILVTSRNRPWKTISFAVGIHHQIREYAELDGIVFHGLRKAAAARLAEAGCSTHEISAITGHASLGMVELYTRKANQRLRATSAIAKLELVKNDDAN